MNFPNAKERQRRKERKTSLDLPKQFRKGGREEFNFGINKSKHIATVMVLLLLLLLSKLNTDILL